jgi:hypothetical protein
MIDFLQNAAPLLLTVAGLWVGARVFEWLHAYWREHL